MSLLPLINSTFSKVYFRSKGLTFNSCGSLTHELCDDACSLKSTYVDYVTRAHAGNNDPDYIDSVIAPLLHRLSTTCAYVTSIAMSTQRPITPEFLAYHCDNPGKRIVLCASPRRAYLSLSTMFPGETFVIYDDNKPLNAQRNILNYAFLLAGADFMDDRSIPEVCVPDFLCRKGLFQSDTLISFCEMSSDLGLRTDMFNTADAAILRPFLDLQMMARSLATVVNSDFGNSYPFVRLSTANHGVVGAPCHWLAWLAFAAGSSDPLTEAKLAIEPIVRMSTVPRLKALAKLGTRFSIQDYDVANILIPNTHYEIVNRPCQVYDRIRKQIRRSDDTLRVINVIAPFASAKSTALTGICGVIPTVITVDSDLFSHWICDPTSALRMLTASVVGRLYNIDHLKSDKCVVDGTTYEKSLYLKYFPDLSDQFKFGGDMTPNDLCVLRAMKSDVANMYSTHYAKYSQWVMQQVSRMNSAVMEYYGESDFRKCPGTIRTVLIQFHGLTESMSTSNSGTVGVNFASAVPGVLYRSITGMDPNAIILHRICQSSFDDTSIMADGHVVYAALFDAAREDYLSAYDIPLAPLVVASGYMKDLTAIVADITRDGFPSFYSHEYAQLLNVVSQTVSPTSLNILHNAWHVHTVRTIIASYTGTVTYDQYHHDRDKASRQSIIGYTKKWFCGLTDAGNMAGYMHTRSNAHHHHGPDNPVTPIEIIADIVSRGNFYYDSVDELKQLISKAAIKFGVRNPMLKEAILIEMCDFFDWYIRGFNTTDFEAILASSQVDPDTPTVERSNVGRA